MQMQMHMPLVRWMAYCVGWKVHDNTVVAHGGGAGVILVSGGE